jgi:hypothetical protein
MLNILKLSLLNVILLTNILFYCNIIKIKIKGKKMFSFELIDLIRPSKADRQLKCSKSIIFDKELSDTNEIAQRGILLHKIAEEVLKAKDLSLLDKKEFDSEDDRELVRNYCEYVLNNFDNFEIEYAVFNYFNNHRSIIDFWSIKDNELHIIDLKTGYIAVNPLSYQNIIYASNLLYELSLLNDLDIKYVNLGIWQYDYLNSIKISVKELEKRMNDLEQVIKDIKDNKLKYEVGTHCKYCNNLKNCKQLHDKYIEINLNDYPTVQEMREAIKLFKIFEDKIKKYKSDLIARVSQGDNIEGVKIVNRNLRKIDEGFLKDYLAYKNKESILDDFYTTTRKLKNIREIEKVCKLNNIPMQDFIKKVKSNPILKIIED